MEGAYQIATGTLRSLSEQQLIDCSQSLGNQGCKGGQMRMGFDYIKANGGVDSEKDYPANSGTAYTNGQCWKQAEKRHVATIDSFTAVKKGSEDALVAAAALGPVSVAIQANQPAFQHYKSGVFDAPCGTALDHGVLVVGYTPDYYTVKNSWGATWGMKGFIELKRGVNATGICGISEQASYPSVKKGTPLPVPAPTDPHTRPALPCNCTQSCTHSCSAFGMTCCGNGHDCDCSTLSACPKCGPPPPPPYAACSASCGAGSSAGKQECLSTQGVPGHICSPGCNKAKTKPATQDCPAMPTTAGVTAAPWCDYCMTGMRSRLPGKLGSLNTTDAEIPTQCALICTATTTKAPFATDGCPVGATCKSFKLDPDPCETTHVELPCAKTDPPSCGMCTYP